MKRKNYLLRDLVDRLMREFKAGRASVAETAGRMFRRGVPMDVALRVIAGR